MLKRQGLCRGYVESATCLVNHLDTAETQRQTPAPDLIPFYVERRAESLSVIVVLKCFRPLALRQIKMSFPLLKVLIPAVVIPFVPSFPL